MTFARESTPEFWDAQAGSVEEAMRAVFAVDPREYRPLTWECWKMIRSCLAADVTEPWTMLDLGCGIGRLTIIAALELPMAHLTGADISERMLTVAKSQGSAGGIRWRHTDGLHVPPGPYDAAWSMLVFQHNPPETCAALVAAVANELPRGGRFLYQTVHDSEPGAVPDLVARRWATDAGFDVEWQVHGPVMVGLPDLPWTWTLTTKP